MMMHTMMHMVHGMMHMVHGMIYHTSMPLGQGQTTGKSTFRHTLDSTEHRPL